MELPKCWSPPSANNLCFELKLTITSTKYTLTCKQGITWPVLTAYITVFPEALRAWIYTNIHILPHLQVALYHVNLLCEVLATLVCLFCSLRHYLQ